MTGWHCAIVGCGSTFETVEALLAHQVTKHDGHECEICGEELPEGYFAIKHGLDEHTRAEYVRAYDGDAAAIREREAVLSDVAEALDADVLEDLLSDERADALDTPEPKSATTS
jgi:DNA repair exonuclease SbcCD ATPase subunit